MLPAKCESWAVGSVMAVLHLSSIDSFELQSLTWFVSLQCWYIQMNNDRLNSHIRPPNRGCVHWSCAVQWILVVVGFLPPVRWENHSHFFFLFFSFFFSVETISATSLYCTDSPVLWKDHLSSGEILSTADINTFNLRNSSNLLSELYHLL